jgi:hypothetical protein
MSTQSEHDRRAEIHTLAKAAAGGPWYPQPNDVIGGWCVTDVDQQPSQGGCAIADFTSEAEARFIAAARSAVPWLLDLVDAKDAALEEDGFELVAAQMERDGANAEVEKRGATILSMSRELAFRDAAIARVRAVQYRARRTHNDWASGHDTGYNNAVDDYRRALDGTPEEGS